MDRLIERVKSARTTSDALLLLYEVALKSAKLEEAVSFCIIAHEGQQRKSGEPYAVHPILVASIVAFLGGDETMVISALLHDIIEDTTYKREKIRELFGDDVANIVEGLTKIVEIRDEKLIPSTSNEKLITSALTFRKILLASIKDVRVLVVKLCDRLHNMLTLEALAPAKQKRIAEETLVVYAPIAHRLGIAALKNRLEDLSFCYIFPEEYKKIEEHIKSRKQQFQIKLNTFIAKVEQIMLKNGFKESDFEIKSRIKHYYSIFLKMQRKGVSIEEVLDLLAIRILVKDPLDVYKSLGLVHLYFKPLIMRFKDYVAIPKENGYQTIHTTVFDDTSIFEVQIRTYEMHKTAELGIAAHWKYKAGAALQHQEFLPKGVVNLNWLNNLQYQNESIEEFYELVKNDLYSEDISVFSPKGDLFTLPRGAVALDFAYAVHTHIGERAVGAIINKQPSTLLTELKNGDIVRIETGKRAILRCSWYDAVRTSKAKDNIRSGCNHRMREIDTLSAYNILASEFKAEPEQIREWIERNSLSNTIHKLTKEPNLFRDLANRYQNESKPESSLFSLIAPRGPRFKKINLENIIVSSRYFINSIEFDYCCHPRRQDHIVAFRSDGKAIIHHKLCEKAYELMTQGEPMLFVEWAQDNLSKYKLIVSLENKKGALANLLHYLVKLDININTIELGTASTKQANYCEMEIECAEANIKKLRAKLESRTKLIELIKVDDAYNQ